jgi:adenylate cyclase class 2
MSIEIEAKLKVGSLKAVENKLGQLGGEFVARQRQSDDFFDDAGETISKSDKALRVRRQQVDNGTRFFLTYKGPKETSNFKKRQEIELEIKEADSLCDIFSALGYKKVLTVEKERRLWRFGGCEVALDTLALIGAFVEIEGPDNEKIADVQKKLGLADVPHIVESYARLVEQKLRINEGKETR